MTDAEATRPGDDGLAPAHIGPYRLLRVLGRGGMGVVYEAEQTAPIRRRVALKIVRAEAASREVIARFEAERQALAVMDHESIANVLDVGTSESGSPWFAMELVRGVPITEYCDVQRLTTQRRVELMIAVCRAVQHAHQKGVIHRDLKPANVLVTEKDGAPLPKIIDFGIAKALGHRLTDKALVTMFGEAIGTPAYMSPEQAEASGLDVDTRTDVYSLGVMLYELLVGRLPIDPEAIGLANFMSRLVNRATDMPTPSAKVTSLTSEREMLASFRHTNAEGLRRELKGDLDWIVMKAIEVDRNRRYDTANGLALDLKRYLANELIEARPPSTSYRVRKFVRRHWPGVVAAAAVVVALLGGAAAATVGFVRASRSEVRASREAATARQVSEFLSGLFTQAVPDRASATSVTAREILDSGATRIERELAGEPLVKARLMQTIGDVYSQLGVYAEAESLLKRALATREALPIRDDGEIATNLTALGRLYTAQGRYAEAESTLARAQRLPAPATRDGQLQHASMTAATGELNLRKGRYAEAESVLRDAVAEYQAVEGPDGARVADATWSLARAVSERGRPAVAESLHRRVLQIRERQLGPDHRAVSQVLSTLASSLVSQRKIAEAESLYRRAIAIESKVYGPTHNVVAIDLYNLGLVKGQNGQHDEAIQLFQQARSNWEASFGPEHPYVAAALSAIGEEYTQSGRAVLAIPLLERALAIQQKKLAAGNTFVMTTQFLLGAAHRRLRQLAVAERYLRLSLQGREKYLDAASPNIADGQSELAMLYRDEGKFAAADSLFARAAAQWERSGRAHSAEWSEMLRGHAEVLRRLGRVAEAESVLAKEVAGRAPAAGERPR